MKITISNLLLLISTIMLLAFIVFGLSSCVQKSAPHNGETLIVSMVDTSAKYVITPLFQYDSVIVYQYYKKECGCEPKQFTIDLKSRNHKPEENDDIFNTDN